MNAGEICQRNVVTIAKRGSLKDAAELMREHHVGDVVVVDDVGGREVPVGILTDRDIVVELVAKGLRLDEVDVGDVMSFELVTSRDDEDVWQVARRMSDKGVRRMPIVDGRGALLGILSADDLLGAAVRYLSDVYRLLLRERQQEAQTRR